MVTACGWKPGRRAAKSSTPQPSANSRPLSRSVTGVELINVFAEIFHRASAAHFHGGGEFTVFDREIAAQDAVPAYLFEGGKLLIDARHSSLNFLQDLRGLH